MKMESTSSSNMSDGPPWLRKYTGALFGNDIFGNKILDSGGAEFSASPLVFVLIAHCALARHLLRLSQPRS